MNIQNKTSILFRKNYQRKQERRRLQSKMRSRKGYGGKVKIGKRGERYINPSHKSFRQYSEKQFHLIAPRVFTIKENKEEVLEFLRKLKETKKKKIGIDLSEVEKINIGAITLLTSISFYLNEKKVSVFGNKPKEERARTFFEKSGFFSLMKTKNIPNQSPDSKNTIFSMGMAETEPTRIASMIENAMETVYGKRMPNKDLYRILMEMMSNSIQHAYEHKKNTRWWVAINHNLVEKKVSFVFLDNGKGIIKTLKPEFLQKLKQITGVNSQDEILQKVFDDKIGSSTKIEGRGRGLPAIYKVREHFSNFVALSNGAYLNFEHELKETVSNQYNGTYYSWELINQHDEHN